MARVKDRLLEIQESVMEEIEAMSLESATLDYDMAVQLAVERTGCSVEWARDAVSLMLPTGD